MKENRDDRLSLADSFWDIEGMLPKRKGRAPFSSDTEAVEIFLSQEEKAEASLKEEAIPSLENTASSSNGGDFAADERIPQEKLSLQDLTGPSSDGEAPAPVSVGVSVSVSAGAAAPEAEGVTVSVSVGEESHREDGERLPTAPAPGKSSENRLLLAREALKKAESKTATAPVERFPVGEGTPLFGGAANPGRAEADPESPVLEYSPEGNPLIRKVSVYIPPCRYSFYSRFLSDAEAYFEESGSPCAPVPFFSYTPQYVQLSPPQLSYYFYWRSLVRGGEYPPVDYSYLLLFIYEILNLPDRVKGEEGARLLCSLWRAYRKAYPYLDRILSEWLCDYCLLHRVPPPAELYGDFLGSITEKASLKEFYVGYDPASPSPFASALFAYASGYDFRKGKFYTPQTKDLFETHIKGAFLYAVGQAEKRKQTVFAPIGSGAMVPAKVKRIAYAGAVCSYPIKREIRLEYLSCSRSVELRYMVTNTVKYAENQVRSLLGIRSRFHTPDLALPLKKGIDEYFAPLKREAKKLSPEEEEAKEYEKLYEAEHSEFSLDYAKALEEKAWETTELLVEGEESGGNPSSSGKPSSDGNPQTEEGADAFRQTADEKTDGMTGEKTAEKAGEKTGERADEETAGEIGRRVDEKTAGETDEKIDKKTSGKTGGKADGDAAVREALGALLGGDLPAFRAVARRENLLPDALCDKINETLYEVLSDTAVEPTGEGYAVLEDYREEIEEWMKK